MAFDYIRPSDHPALIGIANAEWRDAVRKSLEELDYKVNMADNAGDFIEGFRQIPYEICVVEEGLNGGKEEGETALTALQAMPMAQRRHAVVVAVGNSFRTLDRAQALHHSVQAVIHPDQLGDMGSLIEKVRLEEEQLVSVFRRIQSEITHR